MRFEEDFFQFRWVCGYDGALLMAKAKKNALPKDFDALLRKGDLTQLKTVFDVCDVNARGGYGKQTALGFYDCPEELARWLASQGADLSAADARGDTPLHRHAQSRRGCLGALLELGADVNNAGSSYGTPLHAAADSRNSKNTRLLLEHGARADAVNKEGLTPLELALRGCRNSDIEEMVEVAEALLAAGAAKTQRMKGYVEEIGKQFEFHRSNFNPESVEATSRALGRLYEIFDVPAVPRRELHDGKSPITARAETWQKQHQELWELLVPSKGAAATVQGEVIRITGRISNELEGNGGVNWDSDFKKMADEFLKHVQSGKPLPAPDVEEAAALVKAIKARSGDTARMAELGVKWVLQNPKPMQLEAPTYQR